MAGRIAYLGNIATQGLVLNLDATIKGSYPGTGTTWTDVSNNGNNGTLTNGPTFSSADYGSIVFDGVDDYVVIPSSTTITPRTGDFTNDFWINPTLWTNNNWQPVQVTAITNGLWIGQNQNNQFVVRAYGVADRLQYAIRPATGSWTDVSITRNNNLITLYYNGTPVSSSTSNQDFLQATTYLGSDGASGGGTVYFTGRIASDRYYNIGLSQFQVWNNFNSYKSRYGMPDIITDGLVLNLDAGNPYSYLSGSSGTSWANTVAVSSSISGTLVNGPVYSNGAITFDGSDDYVGYGNVLNFERTDSFSLSGWVRISSLSSFRTIIAKMDSSYRGYYFGVDPTGQVVFILRNTISTNGLIVRTTSSPIVINTWYNITVTYNGTSSPNGVNFYVNSTLFSNLVGQDNLSSTILNTQVGAIGARPSVGDGYLPGNISSTQIYNRVLSATEITQNFNALRGRYGI